MSLFYLSYLLLWMVCAMLTYFVVKLMRSGPNPMSKTLMKQDHGLTHGSLFPKQYWKEIEGIAPQSITHKGVVILVTSAKCGACQSVYPQIPLFQKQFPQYQVILLMEGESEIIEQAKEKYEIIVPVVPMTVEALKKELETSMFPFGYHVSSEGQVVSKGLIFGMEQLKPLISNQKKLQKRQSVEIHSA